MKIKNNPIFNTKGELYCKKCDTYKIESEFHIQKSRIDRKERHCYCKVCSNELHKIFKNSFIGENIERHFSIILSNCKYRSKKDKLKSFSNEIDKDFLLKLYKDQDGYCALSGIKMTSYINGNSRYNISIDRINSLLGYTKDNIQLVCNQVNTMKNNLTDSELYEFCKKIVVNLEVKIL